MRYCALLCTHLSFLLFLILYSRGDLITIASSCPSSCGNISIPYPFGIGKGCFLDEWFEIKCNNSISGKPVPYLLKMNKEVVSIDLPNTVDRNVSNIYSELHIKTKIISRGCSSSSNMYSDGSVFEPLSVAGSPFIIGRSNVLVGVGCENKATLQFLETRIVGCRAFCDLERKRGGSKCNGYKCCQTERIGSPEDSVESAEDSAVGNDAQFTAVIIEDIRPNQTQSCRVAFLTDEFSKYPEEKLTDPQWFHNQAYATVQIQWAIPNMSLSFIKSLGCEPGDQEIIKHRLPDRSHMTCQCNHFFKQLQYGESNGWTCQCSKGYHGNPYLPGGCKDIDECQKITSDGKSQYCSEYETCVNIQGGYLCKKKRNKILEITIGLSVGFGVLLIIGISFGLFEYINRKKKYFRRNGGHLLQQKLNSREGIIINKIKMFTSKELKKATENFSSTRVLGEGGQGTVYKGMLVDGSIIAVKKSKAVDQNKVEEFVNEVVILSQINHRNIVKLLGCCLETEVPLLVYEFIPNGNLFEHLHNGSDDYTLATWEVRLRIALDIAEAVSYLHSAATSPIYHRDIKSMNIMLDEKYRAKVSDFGTSRSVTVDHTHLTTLVSGTAGYLDPEYYQSSQLTDKSDVYSFGVVLVELITGQKPISVMRSPENKNLATYFILAMKENKLVDIIDARIRDGCKVEQVIATAHLAKRCLNVNGKRRPNMRAVAMELERIRSPDGNSQSHAQIVEEDDEDEVAMDINFGVESYDNVGVTAPSVLQGNAATTAWLDAEPLFPRQTW